MKADFHLLSRLTIPPVDAVVRICFRYCLIFYRIITPLRSMIISVHFISTLSLYCNLECRWVTLATINITIVYKNNEVHDLCFFSFFLISLVLFFHVFPEVKSDMHFLLYSINIKWATTSSFSQFPLIFILTRSRWMYHPSISYGS